MQWAREKKMFLMSLCNGEDVYASRLHFQADRREITSSDWDWCREESAAKMQIFILQMRSFESHANIKVLRLSNACSWLRDVPGQSSSIIITSTSRKFLPFRTLRSIWSARATHDFPGFVSIMELWGEVKVVSGNLCAHEEVGLRYEFRSVSRTLP